MTSGKTRWRRLLTPNGERIRVIQTSFEICGPNEKTTRWSAFGDLLDVCLSQYVDSSTRTADSGFREPQIRSKILISLGWIYYLSRKGVCNCGLRGQSD